ncbi:MAG: AsmA-like C-terminal region-containing protein [Bacteroidota bacterium]
MIKRSNLRTLFKISGVILLILAVLTAVVFTIIYSNKDDLLQEALTEVNQDFEGRILIDNARFTPFINFPYVSIDLEKVEIHETKSVDSDTVLFVNDVYVGFDFFAIMKGNFIVKKIKLKDGFLNLVQHEDGTLNILKALSGDSTQVDTAAQETESFDIKLKKIELVDIDLLKLNESTGILVEAYIEKAKSSFSTTDEAIEASLKSQFLFNLVLEGDTSFLHDKHVSLETGFKYNTKENLLQLEPSELLIEKAQFLMEGNIDVDDDLNLDLSFSGQKPNFDLFLAFAPEELAPLLSRYDNGGKVFFDATVKGPSVNGKNPHIDVVFGCEEAFVENKTVKKELNDLYFKGHFTNGEKNDPTTMELSIMDFAARPETGDFKGNVVVKNFEEPDINMQLDSEFNLDFLAKFFNLNDLKDVSGKVSLKMNFHDIIDLDNPTKAISKLNESYFSELKVIDLNFTSTSFHLPFKDVNIEASMDGHRANIQRFVGKVGNSDIDLTASISDLPAIIHHTSIPVDVNLNIKSALLDIKELTRTEKDSTGFDEQIKNLALDMRFNSSAKAFTESPNLPIGEFFINKLTADLTHYPHTLHDFKADVLIDSADFRVIDFTGMLDKSDFHFNGKLYNYDLWFEYVPIGATRVDFDLTSDFLQLQDVFSYGGENYVPEDYRNEEFSNLKIHGISKINFKGKLTDLFVDFDKVEAYMKVHDMRFERFSGKFYMDSTRIRVQDFGGKLGNSEFTSDVLFYRKRKTDHRQNSFSLKSPHLDFDQLFSYIPPEENPEAAAKDHDSAFNIFEVPFSNMKFDIAIDHMNYHRYLLDDFVMAGRMQKDHYVYLDKMGFKTAGGRMDMDGYFNGSDPTSIYFSPNITVQNMDLDKLLFKFDNFGQDQLVSDNLHGKLSGKINGKIKMHTDLVPIIEDSKLTMDISVIDGSLKDFEVFKALSSYFTDKNLSLVRFDTLQNTLTLENGNLVIPAMTLNTSLGYFEISGKQSVDLSMDYAIRIPLKVVAKAGFQKLFGKKNQDTSDQVDEIQYRDESKRTRFLNIKVKGTPEEFDISLDKKRKKEKKEKK